MKTSPQTKICTVAMNGESLAHDDSPQAETKDPSRDKVADSLAELCTPNEQHDVMCSIIAYEFLCEG